MDGGRRRWDCRRDRDGYVGYDDRVAVRHGDLDVGVIDRGHLVWTHCHDARDRWRDHGGTYHPYDDGCGARSDLRDGVRDAPYLRGTGSVGMGRPLWTYRLGCESICVIADCGSDDGLTNGAMGVCHRPCGVWARAGGFCLEDTTDHLSTLIKRKGIRY